MKSVLMIAAAAAAFTLLNPSGEARAADHHFGGAHGSVGGHHVGGYSTFGHGYSGGAHGLSKGHAYPSYRAATPHHGWSHRSYSPSYHGGHSAPNYRSYRPAYRGHGHGGLHLDIGRLHLGAGVHHAH